MSKILSRGRKVDSSEELSSNYIVPMEPKFLVLCPAPAAMDVCCKQNRVKVCRTATPLRYRGLRLF